MIFWDSSAVVPLIVSEPQSDELLVLLERDTVVLVWWGTRVECASAIARRERDGDLPPNEASQSIARLEALAKAWYEINPSDAIRALAVRILRVHPLRAADSLQLAAAIVAAEREPRSLDFLTLDDRLRIAAEREGFSTVGP